MNKIIIIGNLTGDPTSRVIRDGVSVCDFTVAVNGRRREGQAQFFRVSAWNKQGENCQKYLAKGRKVCVEGAVSARAYTASDGSVRASLEVSASGVEFLGSASDGDREDDPAPMRQVPSGFTQVEDNDLPF